MAGLVSINQGGFQTCAQTTMVNSMHVTAGGMVVPSSLKLEQQGVRSQCYTIQTPTNGGMKSIAVAAQTFTTPKLEGLIQPRGGGGGGIAGIAGIMGGMQMSEAGPIRSNHSGGSSNNSRHTTRERPSPILVDGEHSSVADNILTKDLGLFCVPVGVDSCFFLCL